jgi:hypothetical protein
VYPSHQAIAERTVIPKREFSPSYAETVRSQDMIYKYFYLYLWMTEKKTKIQNCPKYSSKSVKEMEGKVI